MLVKEELEEDKEQEVLWSLHRRANGKERHGKEVEVEVEEDIDG